jgi:hypothetical protein
LVLGEPWITPFSLIIYRYFHLEDCDLSAQPWKLEDPVSAQGKKAFDGNQAIPYLLFGAGYRQKTLAILPYLQCIKAEPFCLFAYLLSFGFKPMNLLPEMFFPFVSRLERLSLPLWRRFAALRVLLVLEKSREAEIASRPNSGMAAASQG